MSTDSTETHHSPGQPSAWKGKSPLTQIGQALSVKLSFPLSLSLFAPVSTLSVVGG